ncbi:MAG: DUF2378 family protein [Anaeromyxobacteraceae bacterium]
MANASSDPTPRLAERYPRVAAYLESLPRGLASHPQCEARSSIVVHFLAGTERVDEPLPREVAQLLTPPTTLWTPEVRLAATMLAVADQERWSDAQHQAWLLARNRELLSGIVYRALMAFLSPAALLEKAAARWSSLHRGTELDVERSGEREVVGRLSHPPRLFTAVAPAYGAAFQAAIEHSRARTACVTEEDVTATCATYRARWT